MQRNLFNFCVQTDQKLLCFKLLWFVWTPFDSSCKQVRFRASRNLSSELTALASCLKIWRGKHSNLPKKTCRQKNNLAGRPETTCLSVNDINSKRYKQPGEVKHSSCISSRNSPEKTKYGQT